MKKFTISLILLILFFSSCENSLMPNDETTNDDTDNNPTDYDLPTSGFTLFEGVENTYSISDIINFIPDIETAWSLIPNGTISDIKGIRHMDARRNITEDYFYEYPYSSEGQFTYYTSSTISEEPMPGVYMMSDSNLAIKYFGSLYPHLYYGSDLTYAINTQRFDRYDYTIENGIMTLNYYENSSYDPYYVYLIKLDSAGNGYFSIVGSYGNTYYIFNNFRLVARTSDESSTVHVPIYSDNGLFLYTSKIVRDELHDTFIVDTSFIDEKSVPPTLSDQNSNIIDNNGTEFIFNL